MSSTKKVKARRMWHDAPFKFIDSTAIQKEALPVFVLPADPASYERILNQFQYAFNRAPVGKEIERGFAAIGIVKPKA